MGIFDFIKNIGGTPEAKIQKAADMAKNPKAIRDDRWAAIEYLAESVDDAELGVAAMLPRFEFSLEHGINDSREKEKCMEGIIRHGDKALPLVLDHLKNTTRISWPIKILKALGRSETHVIECLVGTLEYSDVSFDQGKTDKNYDILCHLADYKSSGLHGRVIHFLKDPDERVRFAAAEVLMEQDLDEAGDTLEGLMRDENPDNSRIRQSIARKYLENGWVIRKPDAFVNRQVIGPVFVNEKNILFIDKAMPGRYS
jgi:HEAT repeat protein